MMIPSCKDVAWSLSSGDFDAAPRHRRLLLRLHMLACWICRRYAAQLRFLGHAARAGRARVGPEAAEALKARILQRLGGS